MALSFVSVEAMTTVDECGVSLNACIVCSTEDN